MSQPRDVRYGERLLLRVRPPHASWVFRFTAPSGRRREMGMGRARIDAASQPDSESLQAARAMAAEATRLLALGADPIEHRDEVRRVTLQAAKEVEAASKKAERERKHWTLARCARDFHERVIEPTRSDKHAAQWIKSLENHMPPALWATPIAEVTERQLLDAIMAIQPHERARRLSEAGLLTTKKRIAGRLSMVFAEAVLRERVASNVAAQLATHIGRRAPRKKVEHMRALPYREAPEFMRRLRNMEGTAARTLEFAVLTASRTGEVLGARWNEVDEASATWTVPSERMKNNGRSFSDPHVVHLSPRAMAILQEQKGLDATFLFASPVNHGEPQSSMAMLAVLDRMHARHRTTVHGLCRATFSTWANENKVARPEVIEAALAHKLTGSDRPYNRARYLQERAELLDRWAEFLTT